MKTGKLLLIAAVNKVEALEGIVTNIKTILDSDLEDQEKLNEIKNQTDSYER